MNAELPGRHQAQLLIEELADVWVVIDASDDPANLAPLLRPVERRIDAEATSEVRKVARRDSGQLADRGFGR